MIKINVRSGVPLYEQIVEEVKFLLFKGVLREDDQLPTVRELSAKLTINPNTIQKAYQELEKQGYVYTKRGRGKFLSDRNHILSKSDLSGLEDQLMKQINEMIFLGMDKEQFTRLIDRAFKSREETLS